jgi:two-component system chemotaxis response regulator CheY
MNETRPGHRCSVLVVDDNPDVRELLRVALQGEDYTVACVDNGRAALNYLRSHALTCIIVLDLMLPVMDGAHFRTAQLHDRSLAWIPVVLMSGAADADRRARELGIGRLVKKPLDLDEVKRALNDVGCCQVRPRRTENAG